MSHWTWSSHQVVNAAYASGHIQGACVTLRQHYMGCWYADMLSDSAQQSPLPAQLLTVLPARTCSGGYRRPVQRAERLSATSVNHFCVCMTLGQATCTAYIWLPEHPVLLKGGCKSFIATVLAILSAALLSVSQPASQIKHDRQTKSCWLAG